jgi:hypothetical protein
LCIIKKQEMETEKNYYEALRRMKESNYSDRSIEAMFDAERRLDDEIEAKYKYAGMNQTQKQAFMKAECDEICECNMIWDYYNS